MSDFMFFVISLLLFMSIGMMFVMSWTYINKGRYVVGVIFAVLASFLLSCDEYFNHMYNKGFAEMDAAIENTRTNE